MLDKMMTAVLVAGAFVLGCALLGGKDEEELRHEALDRLARDAQWQTDLRWTGTAR